MNKTEAIEDLLKSLRVSLNHAVTYFPEHPMFVRSMDDLYTRISVAIPLVVPLRINIALHSLHIAELCFEGIRTYRDLAEMFHSRKLKCFEFSPRINPREVTLFVSMIAKSAREIFAQGGLVCMVQRAGLSNITVLELDYSQLLAGDGEKYKDVWTFLFGSAVAQHNTKDIDALAENFPRILEKFKVQDFIERPTLRENIIAFLEYLKHTEKEKFHVCSRELAKAILRDKSILPESRIEKLQLLFAHIGEEDLARVFWDQVLTADDFDVVSFSLFSRLTDREKHRKISSVLADTVSRAGRTATPRMKKKIRELFTKGSTPFILEVYRHVFMPLLDEISYESAIVFDRQELKRNYRLALLDFLGMEKSLAIVVLAEEKITEELEELVRAHDFASIEVILEFLFKLEQEDTCRDCKVIFNHLSVLLEDFVLAGGLLPEKKIFMRIFARSSREISFYISKIVEEVKVYPAILELFFIFFPRGTERLCNALRRRREDHAYLKKIIEALGEVDRPASTQVLRFIYFLSEDLVKRDVLNAMQYISAFDENFVCTILRIGDSFTKKQALAIVRRSDGATMRAVSVLLNIFNLCGIRNGRLRENIRIIGELNLIEAASMLAAFAKKSFWNIPVRRDIRVILARWQSGDE